MRYKLFVVSMTIALTGCLVGPNYKRPVVQTPSQYRAAEPQLSDASLGDTRWFDLFQDETLRDLIKEALRANFDVNIAAQRVLQAEGRLTATRSELFPQLNAPGTLSRNGLSSPIQSAGGGFYGTSWELDLFGKLRRAAEAARADLQTADWDQKTVMQSLIAQVATAYFDLLEYDAELDYVRESIGTRQESVKLVSARVQGGVASALELDQAKTLVASAEANAALLEKAQEQTENLINFLIGRQPDAVVRGKSLVNQPQPPEIPAGLPSALLERRPDLRAAEQQLIAANARVGVAKAAFYPSINLTGVGGIGTTDLLGVVSRSGGAYAMAGVVDLPIFDSGRRMGNYTTAKAARGAFTQLSESHRCSLSGRLRCTGRPPEDQAVHQQPESPDRDTARPKPACERALSRWCQQLS